MQRSDLTNSTANKDRLSFNAAVLMSIFGVGVSLFSTNRLLIASSTRSVLTKNKWIDCKNSCCFVVVFFSFYLVKFKPDMKSTNIKIISYSLVFGFLENETK